jgi:hypothetical protein
MTTQLAVPGTLPYDDLNRLMSLMTGDEKHDSIRSWPRPPAWT